MSFSVPEKEAIDKYKQEQNDLYQQKKRLEAKLSSLSHNFTIKQKISKANSEIVSYSLPPGTVLLEFARINMNNLETKDEKEKVFAFLGSWVPALKSGQFRFFHRL